MAVPAIAINAPVRKYGAPMRSRRTLATPIHTIVSAKTWVNPKATTPARC